MYGDNKPAIIAQYAVWMIGTINGTTVLHGSTCNWNVDRKWALERWNYALSAVE